MEPAAGRSPEPVLAPIDLPPELEACHEAVRALSAELCAAIAAVGADRTVDAGTDLLTADHGLVWVREGFFRLEHRGKLVRMYCDGDLVTLRPSARLEHLELKAVFAGEITTFAADVVEARLAADAALRARFDQLARQEAELLVLLCATYAADQVQPRVDLCQFAAGEIIIAANSAPDDIFVLVRGSAEVTVDGIVVGTVAEGEFFGELSFLTGRVRTATVTAAEDCMVQRIAEAEFARLVACKPNLGVQLSKNLAKRIVDLNGRIAAAARG